MARRPDEDDTILDLSPALAANAETTDFTELVDVDSTFYRIEAELARGGMGRIMIGRDLRAGRAVAVKEILAELLSVLPEAERQLLYRRFEREARITAGLQHPAIVPVYEIGRRDGQPFFAMKRVEGEPLGKVIDRTKNTADRFALLPKLIAISDALAYAHERGVIHRDLKPANVLVGDHGETVVIDWGLAKQLDNDDPEASDAPVIDSDDGLKTRAGSVLGTPHYMPPEQADGLAGSRAVDVYAIGAMLYHVFTGTPPYRDQGRKTHAEVLSALGAGPPTPVGELAPDTPSDLISIIEKAMARSPSDRYPSASGLADDLRQFQAGQMVAVHDYSFRELVGRWVGRHRAAVATAAVALVILIAAGAYFVNGLASARDSAEEALEVATAEKQQAIRILTSGGRAAVQRGDMVDAAFRLSQAYKLDPETPGLRNLLGAIEVMLPSRTRRVDDGIAHQVVIPPKAKRFAVVHAADVKVYDVVSGALAGTFSAPSMKEASLSSDGRYLLTYERPEVVGALYNVDTGQLLRKHRCPVGVAGSVMLSPDGRYVVMRCSDGLVVVNESLSGDELARLTTWAVFNRFDISDDSSKLTLSYGGRIIQSAILPLKITSEGTLAVDASYARLDGDHRRAASIDSGGNIKLVDLTTGVLDSIVGPWEHCGLSPDGELIMATRGDRELVVLGLDKVERARFDVLNVESFAMSSDNRSLAAVGSEGVVRVFDLESGRLVSEHLGLSEPGLVAWLDERRLLAVDRGRGVLLIDAGDLDSRELARFESVQQIRYGAGGSLIAATTAGLRMFTRTEPGSPSIATGRTPYSLPQRMVSTDGRFASAEGIHDAKTGELVFDLPEGPKSLARLSPDGDAIAAASGLELTVYRASDGAVIRRHTEDAMKGNPYLMIGAVDVAPGARSVAYVVGGTLTLLDLTTDSPPTVLTTNASPRGLEYTTDGELLLSSSGHDELWNVELRTRVFRSPVMSAGAFLAGDKYIVQTFGRAVEVRDLSGRRTDRLPKYAGRPVASAANGYLAVATSVGLVDIWKLETNELIYRRRHGHPIRMIALAPDASEYAISEGKVISVFEIPTVSATPDELIGRLRRVYATDEFENRYVLDQ